MEGETNSSAIAPAALLPSKEGRKGRMTSTGKDMTSDVMASHLARDRRPGHPSNTAETKTNGTDSRCNLPSNIMN